MANNGEWNVILEQGKKIYIFGTGGVGKHLRNMVRESEWAYKFRGYVVTSKECDRIDGDAVYSIDEVKAMESEGTMLLVSVTEVYHPEVYDDVRGVFETIVPAVKFFSMGSCSAAEKRNVILSDVQLDKDEIEIRDEIIEKYFEATHTFGGDTFYQSFPRFGICGERSTEMRLKKYKLEQYLHSDYDVLDIGCNVGFLDLSIADKVKEITALEYDENLSAYSRYIAKLLNIENVNYISGDFNDYDSQGKKYDCIFSFAVHIWIGMSPDDYSNRICSMLNDRGILLFESQNISGDKMYNKFCQSFIDRGLSIIEKGSLTEKNTEREFSFFRKRTVVYE
ncbi:MAG: methyltransferase domain-containing protein [Lachnospiraceae bacterium]|nr:methyltransferase domain-containing protein [Lachnospiraceae bacterium]